MCSFIGKKELKCAPTSEEDGTLLNLERRGKGKKAKQTGKEEEAGKKI